MIGQIDEARANYGVPLKRLDPPVGKIGKATVK